MPPVSRPAPDPVGSRQQGRQKAGAGPAADICIGVQILDRNYTVFTAYLRVFICNGKYSKLLINNTLGYIILIDKYLRVLDSNKPRP